MDNNDVADFYDDYIAEQAASGANERIYSLYRRAKKLGVNNYSNFLELGCGIGAFTRLLRNLIKKGSIEAVDISPASIDFARKNVLARNIKFTAEDILHYSPSVRTLDFISLFDVIEHIPIEKHLQLFEHLSSFCTERTKILINIPNPRYIEFDILNNPEGLQIIDQPIPLSAIVENTEKAGLQIDFFETYSIWVENDYQFFVISKQKRFEEIRLSDKRNLLQKIFKRAERIYVKTRFR